MFGRAGILTSGAGKTTLLNTLSQRQRIGFVSGEMLVDGRPLGPEFQRITGFVEQMDLHDATATIREAIEFSAILRQERHVSKAEKLTYVDEIIDLLELRPLQDALISSLGVEQRKRVTIGVELAAKPSLIFLDEPTSGLDSQSAFSIVRFLRKLARAGHGLICTIHQPSSLLIQQFDMILALNPGGRTFYFGPVGPNGAAVNKYFADRGVYCPPSKNIAEFILETAAKGGKRADGKRLDWNIEWRSSPENKALISEISYINAERSKLPGPQVDTQHEFASPVWLQITTLTRRMFTQHWRSPSYLYGKLFVAVIIGIFNGFTFYQLGNSVLDMQSRMFTAFLIVLIPPTVVNAVVPKFYQNLSLWESREHPARIYNWVAFCTASVVTEIPISCLSAVIYWLLWYFATGLPTDSSTAGYVFLMTLLFFLFQASWGQWICAFAPSFTVISNILPFFFVMFGLFNGVVRPYDLMPAFWRYWLYYLIPSTYWIGGVMAATLPSIPVICAPGEAALFNPPPGQTCAQYASAFVQSAGRGYLTNPTAPKNCGYCPYKNGTEYMATLNVVPGDKWKYFGIFLAFCCSNWALVYFFVYTVRIRGWSFGLGHVFGGLGRGVDMLKRPFRSKAKKG
jgi:ATP-binding cassette subfamily G (WHITE) protein 2 (SNQ2)